MNYRLCNLKVYECKSPVQKNIISSIVHAKSFNERRESVFHSNFLSFFFLSIFQECVLERKLKGLLERDLEINFY
jgi:hypothetical protein